MREIGANQSFWFFFGNPRFIIGFLLYAACVGVNAADNAANNTATWSLDWKRTWGPCQPSAKCLDQIRVSNACVVSVSSNGADRDVTLTEEKCNQLKKLAIDVASLGGGACPDARIMDFREQIMVKVDGGEQVDMKVTQCKVRAVESIRTIATELLSSKP